MHLRVSKTTLLGRTKWKKIMEDNGLKEYIDINVSKPTTADAQNRAEWKKNVAKARRILLEGVRDHIVSNLHGKDTPYAMWKASIDLF